MFNTKEYVAKINELYITTRSRYLRLKPTDSAYKRISEEKAKENGWKWIPLNDSHIENHLKGKYSIAVYSGDNLSKFLAIDVDLFDKKDKVKLKWIYQLIVEAFDYVGVDKEYLHVSYSGGGGIHVLLLTEGVALNFHKNLYNAIMKRIIDNLDVSVKFDKQEYCLDIENYAKLEMRPTGGLGIRLDLGRNWKHKNKKTNKGKFLDKDTLELLPDNYLLSIEQMPKDEFYIIMDSLYDRHKDVTFQGNIEEDKELIIKNIQENFSHKVNRDEKETIEYVKSLLLEGLPMSGTRNNSTFKIAKYFSYMGLDENDAENKLIEWMKWQDKNKYSISLEEAIIECRRIVKLVYEKGYPLISQVADLHIYKSEIEKIMTINNRNDKLLLYTMLLHSKRFSTQSGIFYMTYKQMSEMCGISRMGAIDSIKRLENSGMLEVVSRNIKEKGSYMKKPNRYKICLNVPYNDKVLTVSNRNNIITNDYFYESVTSIYTNKELKKIMPKRQYTDIVKYREKVSV